MADRLEQALAVAQAEADEERDRILAATRGHSDEEALQIWEDERSVWLQYLEEEVRVAETNLLLREIRKYHLPRECHELCVSGLAHAGFRYSHALKRSSNIMAK